MGDFWARLLDPAGFVPRKDCGAWTDGLVWLHLGSDLAIWLAYLSIPLVLASFVGRERRAPFPWLVGLFALFILGCGFTHLADALMFHWPAYRLSGLLKAGTAAVSWATVFALVTTVPRLDEWLARLPGAAETNPHRLHRRPVGWGWDYAGAAAAAALAVLVRAALDPFLGSDHAFVFALVAVVYVAWQRGFGPGVTTLLLSMGGIVYFFVEPRGTFVVTRLSDQVAVAAFFFCGACCAALGQAQKEARRRAHGAFSEVLDRKTALESEMARRATAESALRLQEAQFSLLADNIAQLAWITDETGAVVWYNRRWFEYTGTTPEEMKGWGWKVVQHPDHVERVTARFAAAVRAGEDWEDTFPLRGADGTYRWFLSRAHADRGPDGTVTRWFGTNTDITERREQAETLERLVQERTAELTATNAALRTEVEERRRAEAQAAGAARELRRSNAELEQFAYVASHDLQEPLRKIQAFGDLLATKHARALPDEARSYVHKMQASAGRMSRLIDDLLAYSRVTTHARPFARVDLGATVREVVEDLEVRAEKVGGRVEVGPLPALTADPVQMRQLFQNLIGNALKFHRPDAPPVVRVWAEPAGGGWRVGVSDNGIGFEDRFRERIFQVFQRLHGRDEYDGTGVGLAICKKITDRHGGTIAASGRPGEGATFVVSFPADPPAPSP